MQRVPLDSQPPASDHQAGCPCCSGERHKERPNKEKDEQCQASTDRLRADSLPWEAAKTGDSNKSPSAGIEERRSEFEKKNAITVSQNGGKYEYKLSAGGKDRVLFTTDATAKGLDEAEKKLAKEVQEKQDQLSKTFKVTFSKEGDDVVLQWIEKPDCTWERGPMVKARTPQLIELYGIEAALYRCQPSHLNKAGNEGVKFHFLKDNYYKDQPVLAYFVHSDKDGKPSVYFEPGANKGKPATEEDADRIGKHHLFSIEALTVHELNHHHQKKMGWHNPKDKEVLAKEIGWVPLVDPVTAEQDWLLKAKNGDLYRYGRDHCKDSKVWVKVNNKGEPLDDKGKPAGSFAKAKQFTRGEVTADALVKPVTYYFVNPTEMFAEGLMMLRLQNKYRSELLKESPTLYESVKKQDQKEIDHHYGTNPDGSPKYIRGVAGHVVDNNDANRKQVAEFEQKIQKERQDKKPDAGAAARPAPPVRPLRALGRLFAPGAGRR